MPYFTSFIGRRKSTYLSYNIVITLVPVTLSRGMNLNLQKYDIIDVSRLDPEAMKTFILYHTSLTRGRLA